MSRRSRVLLAAAFGLIGAPAFAAAETLPPVVWPAGSWQTATPAEMGMDSMLLAEAESYARTGGGAGVITRGGKLVMSWGNLTQRFDLKSTTKSIGTTVAGLAIADGLIAFEDRAQLHLSSFGLPPSTNTATGWLDDVTLMQLATHTAGFPKPGGYSALGSAPGTLWTYSDGGLNWLADVLTQTFREDLNSLLFRRVFSRLGITTEDLVWRKNRFRDDTLNGVKRREFAAGISADVDAMARIGYLYLRSGDWNGEQLLPSAFVDTVRRPSQLVVGLPVTNPASFPDATDRYGVGWFTNADATLPEVPTDAYWAWGLGDSTIVVIPSLDIVAVRAGSGFLGRSGWNADYAAIAPFITPIARSVARLPVPDVVGLTHAEAQAAILSAGLAVGRVTTTDSDTMPAGGVLSQEPEGGGEASPGTLVALVISTGPANLVVPDVVGLTQSAAESAIGSAGLTVGTVTVSASDTLPVGDVISQSPAGGSPASAGAIVSLVVSAGPAGVDSSLEFDGGNDRVVIPDAASLRLTGNVTVEAWIRPRSLANSTAQDRIVSKGSNYELTLSTGDTGCAGGTSGHVQWRATIAGKNKRICGGVLSPGSTHHVAGSYDGSKFILYIDGSPVASMNRSGTMTVGSPSLVIGNNAAGTRGFDGRVDDVAVWNRALSATEVLARVAIELTGSESGLVSYWSFDEASGQSAFDAGANDNRGTLGLGGSADSADPTWQPGGSL